MRFTCTSTKGSETKCCIAPGMVGPIFVAQRVEEELWLSDVVVLCGQRLTAKYSLLWRLKYAAATITAWPHDDAEVREQGWVTVIENTIVARLLRCRQERSHSFAPKSRELQTKTCRHIYIHTGKFPGKLSRQNDRYFQFK